MPELHFKGKEYVYNHHLTVPYRPLEAHPDKSIGDKDDDSIGAGSKPKQETVAENLIIHGDNLHALKALLPCYAGKVDCIFIDPPYNTGNENWSYNDNVNSPMTKEWLDGNPVNKEDMLRHDKWCCLMYPRLKLLHELLSENGSLWMTLDDNEVHHGRLLLDDIFGEDCCVGQLAWQKRTSRENRATLSPSFDHLILYTKGLPDSWKLYRNLLEPGEDGYSNPDDDTKGDWKSIPFSAQGYRKNQDYIITTPTGKKLNAPKGRCWGATEPEFEALIRKNRIYWPRSGDGRPRVKQYSGEAKGLVPETLWLSKEVGDTEGSKKLLLSIFSDREELDFHAPKPPSLIQRILSIATTSDSVVLDSFAGTASTAHAVLAQNAKDNNNRSFILVECEDYANELTAERVRRVINGYEFKGTQKEKLLRKKITWSNFSKDKTHQKLLDQVQSLENLESLRFDKIKKEIKDGELIVTGEKKITERVEGLGGGFTYYTLGDPLDLDKMLTGESLPDYTSIGSWLFHTATGEPLDPRGIREDQSYLGSSISFHVWLIYRPELDFLKSRNAALTLSFAERIAETKDKRHLVFAPARFVSNKILLPLGVEYAPLPFALYRFEKG